MSNAPTAKDRAELTALPRILLPLPYPHSQRYILARQASMAPPLAKLPGVLYPSKLRAMQPPKMLFGFLIPFDALMPYAREHGLESFSDTLHSDEEDDTEDEEEKRAVHPPPDDFVDRLDTAVCALGQISDELGLVPPITIKSAANNLREGDGRVIALLCTNYNRRSAKPKKEAVARLVSFLQGLGADPASVQPKWYISADRWRWWDCTLNR